MRDSSDQATEPTATAAEAPAPSLFTILPFIVLPMALAFADQTIVSTALPAIAGGLGNVGQVSWIIVTNLVAAVIAAPVYGQLRDVYGGRRMMLIALAIYLAASLFSASATSLGMLIVGRILQGIGGGGLMTLSQALIGETVPPRERAKYQGYLAAVMVTATTLGPVIGGYLTSHFGWRSVFLYNLPIGAVAMWLTLSVPNRVPTAGRWIFDTAGLVCFVGFIAPFLLALDATRTLTAGGIPAVVTLLALSGVALGGLIWQERRAFSPLLPVALLSQRTIWMSDALAACHGATLVSLVTLLPLYLHVMRGTAASETGLLLVPLMAGIGTGSMITGRLVSRTGYTAIFPSVGLTVAAALLLVQAFVIQRLSPTGLALCLLGIGAAMGTVMGVVQVTVQSAAGGKALGSAAASVQISRSVGAAVGTALTGAVLFGALHLGPADATASFTTLFQGVETSPIASLPPNLAAAIARAFFLALLTNATFATAGAIVAWRIPKRRL